jgi:MFS family permease
LRLGVIVTAAGIFLCHWAAPAHQFWWFGIGVLIWRLGEGLNDVTIEAICPEMLPKEQFEKSSAIKASMFLLGGVLGYVMIGSCTQLHYSWLYSGYLILMFATALPTIMLINQDLPRPMQHDTSEVSFLRSCIDAYVRPAMVPGGFPLACFCLFLFSAASTPMFYMLLMLRDLVGITQKIRLQSHFSLISIDFFLSAAVAAILNNVLFASKGPKGPPQRRISYSDADNTVQNVEARTFRITGVSVFFCGLWVLIYPFGCNLNEERQRLWYMYIVGSLFGLGFGSVYARFQDCMWQLMPANSPVANIMGFASMCKLFGAGFGNFVGSLILDAFPSPDAAEELMSQDRAGYRPSGYIVVFTVSAILAFITAGLVILIPPKQAKAAKEQHSSRSESSALNLKAS